MSPISPPRSRACAFALPARQLVIWIVTLRHTGVPDDEMGRQHQAGWEWVLSALEQQFTSRKA